MKLFLILVFDGFQSIDLSGPLQVISTANEELPEPGYDIRVISVDAGRVKMHPGINVWAEDGNHFVEQDIDTLMVIGGPGVHEAKKQEKYITLIKRLHARARRSASVCTGAFLFAEAGLLDDMTVTTHWGSCSRLQREYPQLRVDEDPLYLRAGNIWTAAGVTAGIDLTLALLEADYGTDVTLAVARRLVVYMRRSGGQSQYSQPLTMQSGDVYTEMLQWVCANLKRRITVDEMADHMGVTKRTFQRRFADQTGLTPARAIERVRLDEARRLMETTSATYDYIAGETGFRNTAQLRLAFERNFGISMKEWRERFATQNRGRPAPRSSAFPPGLSRDRRIKRSSASRDS